MPKSVLQGFVNFVGVILDQPFKGFTSAEKNKAIFNGNGTHSAFNFWCGAAQVDAF